MQRGFSITEIILSVALFGIFVTGLAGNLWYGAEADTYNIQQTQALSIAQEGIEAVRAIRDYPNFSWDTDLAAGSYGVTTTSGFWTTTNPTDTLGIFDRTLSVSTVSPNRKRIDSLVTWTKNPNRNGSISLTSYLTNWQEPQTDEKSLRVTEYFLESTDFTGATYNLTLDNELMENYFVLVAGSDGDGSSSNNTGPDENYIGLTGDPFASGDLATSASSSTLAFRRGGDVNYWHGVVTVVECLGSCNSSGFLLRSVETVVASGTDTSGTDTVGTSWSDINQVVLFGGAMGSGCYTTDAGAADHKTCAARIYPSGTNQINWTRNGGGTTLATGELTIMAVEWGNEWTVQRVNVIGTNGGNGANAANEYETQSLATSVARDNTWVWGTGWTTDEGIGDGPEGVLVTVGNGLSETSSPITTIAIGSEYQDNKDFEVYTMTHDNLAVDYIFKADGDSGNVLLDTVTDTVTDTDSRFAIVYNGTNGTGTAYPRPLFSARYSDSSTIRLERRRSGQNWPAWIQGINTSSILLGDESDSTAPSAISNLGLSGATTSTIDLAWTAPGDDLTVGTAASYDVRYSTALIDSSNWSSATQASGEPTPQIAGSSESMTVNGLASSTLYYFAIKTSDEVPNESDVSNSPSLTTIADASTEADDLTVNIGLASIGGGGSKELQDITVSNTGAGTITITKVTVTWTNGNDIEEIEINNDRIWKHNNEGSPDGRQPTGTEIDVDDIAISSGSTVAVDKIKFNGNMSGDTFTILFEMSDGSTHLVTSFSP